MITLFQGNEKVNRLVSERRHFYICEQLHKFAKIYMYRN